MADKVIPLSGVRSDGEIQPRRFECVPPPPRQLSKRAREIWRAAAKDLHDRAILTVLDTTLLAGYCWMVATAENLEDLEVRGVRTVARDMWRSAREAEQSLLLPRGFTRRIRRWD